MPKTINPYEIYGEQRTIKDLIILQENLKHSKPNSSHVLLINIDEQKDES